MSPSNTPIGDVESFLTHHRTLYHPAGSASMGKVVDTDLRVKGIDRLRVVDASVIPTPLATHIQMCIYALAEHAADIILQGH